MVYRIAVSVVTVTSFLCPNETTCSMVMIGMAFKLILCLYIRVEYEVDMSGFMSFLLGVATTRRGL